MSRSKKNYDEDFKETIKELYNNGKSIKELSGEYGIPQSTLRHWFLYDSKKDIEPMSKEELELKALKKQIKDMKEENDILKKALTIFAQK